MYGRWAPHRPVARNTLGSVSQRLQPQQVRTDDQKKCSRGMPRHLIVTLHEHHERIFHGTTRSRRRRWSRVSGSGIRWSRVCGPKPICEPKPINESINTIAFVVGAIRQPRFERIATRWTPFDRRSKSTFHRRTQPTINRRSEPTVDWWTQPALHGWTQSTFDRRSQSALDWRTQPTVDGQTIAGSVE